MRWFLIVLGGSIHGSLYDPLVWLLMAIGFALGLARAHWAVIVGGAVAVAAVRAYVSISNRVSMGSEQDPLFTSIVALAGVLLFLLAWGVARLIRRAF